MSDGECGCLHRDSNAGASEAAAASQTTVRVAPSVPAEDMSSYLTKQLPMSASVYPAKSAARGKAHEYEVGSGGVIKGWEEAMPLLSVGEQAVVTMHHELAYGSRARGKIPKFADITFEIEVLEVKRR